MTLEEINRRLKKNPYYQGSQAQKEENMGVKFQNNNVIVPKESRAQIEQIRQEYGNGNTDNNFSKRDYSYITINKNNKNNKIDYSKFPSMSNIIETPRMKENLSKKSTIKNNKEIIKEYQTELDNLYRSKEYTELQNWLNTDTNFKKNLLSDKYNERLQQFETLQDKAKELNKKIDDIKKENIDLSDVTDTDRLLAPLNSAYTGVQSTVRGLGNAINRLSGNEELLYEGITPEEYKAQKVREKQNGVERVVSDMSSSVGQMAALAPVSAIPYVGKVASLAALGLSAGGESYKQSIEEGKSDEEALKYASLVGTGEALLQKALGGVKVFGNSIVGDKVNNVINKVVKSEVGKKSLQYMSDMLGEGFEEYLQEILNPVYRNISFNENNKVNPLDEDALYSGLIGTLSAGAMNVPSYIASKNKANVEFPVANENNRYTKSSLDEMLNNKELPMQSYQYEKSENTKINALRQDANKYFNNTEQSHNFVNMLEKIITDKNVEIKFDANLKTPDGRVANGSYSNGVITINPNSNKAGEFIAIHELTHAIGTDSMKNIIETYRKSNTEFDTSVKKLLQNYNSSEITEEALSDVSAQLFGNQEFINNIAQNNPNIFQKIYSEIKYLWHQFRGYKNQNQFVEDLYYKWTQAYNSSNKLNNTTNYLKQITSDGIEYIKSEQNLFTKEDGSSMTPIEAYNSLVGKTIDFGDGDSAYILKRLPGKNLYDELFKRYPKFLKNISDAKKLNADVNNNIVELLENSKNINPNEPDVLNRHIKQGITNFDTRVVNFYDGNNAYKIEFSIAKLNDGKKVAYAKKFFGLDNNLTQKIKADEAMGNKSQLNQQPLLNNSIPSSNENVNTTKYSIQESENNSGSFNFPKLKEGYTRLYRGLENEYDSNYDKTKLDNSNGYESWTDNYELAKAYGDNVYYIDVPTDTIKNSIIDEDSMSETYGDRNLLYKNDKAVGIKGKSGNEYMLYTDHDNYENIKYNKIDANMSVQDNQGRTLTKEQQEYFKDSKVRDENGNLEVMYHGTDNGGFNTFDINQFGKNDNGWLGKGFYLTNDFDYAESYAKELYSDEYTQNGEVKETYINLKNPYILTDEKYSRNPTLLQEELGAKNSTEVTEILKTKGYDGVLLEYEDYKGNNFKEVMVFNSNQIKNIDNTNPTDNPDIRFSQNNTTWQSYLDENYKPTGTRTNLQDIKLPTKEWIENRQKLKKSQNNIPIAKEYINKNTLNPLQISNLTENDVTTTPKLPDIKYKTDKGNNSKFYNNLMNKTGMLNDDLRKIIKNQDDIKYYEGVTNVQSLREANERLQKNGSKETFRWFSKDLSDENTTVSATEVAEGWILLKQYQDAGDYESAVNVAKKMRDMATKSGQALQAYSIQARLTPEGMFQYAQSELQEAFEKFSKNKTQEWIDNHKRDFDLKPEETQAIIEKVKEAQELPNDSQEKKNKLGEINKIITDKLPPERGAGIKAWMRISMLFNSKTQVRNVLGNAVIAPVNSVSDVFSTIADKALSKKTGVRTTGLSNPIQNIKGFGKGLYNSHNDFKKGINTREISGDRFEIGQGKSFKDKGLGKYLNKVDHLLSFMLDVGDRPFYEATFTNSINNQLVLNNTDVVTKDMIDIATNEALSRTWQDNNAYTKAVLGIRKDLNKLGNIGGYGLGDVFIPFAKTPANLTKAIIDYSPVGMVTSLIEGNNVRKAISRGDLTAQQQHKFVQDLGKATVGSMLYILGYALAKAGITSGESDEDKDVANFIKNNLGTSQYSIKIGDKTFTYDWAQPVAAPIAMMANLVGKKKEDTDTLNKILDTLDVPMNMLLEQSFMSSIKDVFSNYNGLPQAIFEEIAGLPSRAVPTLLKQITDMTDTTQRTSYEKGKPIQTAVNQVKAKIPGLSKQLAPVSNTLGKDIKKYGGETDPFLYAFHTFINPANVNSNQKNKAGSEIYKVYQKTGDKTIFPRQAEYTQTIDGTKITLTSNERYQYQKTSGKYYSNVVNELLKSDTYKSLSSENKAEILKEIANDSNEKAKEELAKNKKLEYEREKTDVKIEELVNNGLEYSNAYIYKTQIKDIDGDKDSNGKTISSSSNAKQAKYIMDMDTEDVQKDKLLSLLSDTDTVPTVSDLKKLNGEYLTYMQQSGKKQDGVSQRDKYMMYIDAGIPVKILNKYYEEIGKIEGTKNSNGKTISGSKKRALFNYINNLNLNTTQKKILFTKCNSSYGKNYKNEIFEYINSLNISKQRKEAIWKELYD